VSQPVGNPFNNSPAVDPFEDISQPNPANPFEAPPPPTFDPFESGSTDPETSIPQEEVPLGDVFGDPEVPASVETNTPELPEIPPTFDPFEN
jgi:hypothetical protein